MEVAHVLLAIGGDAGHSVTKRFVTPSEVAVLRSIHSPEAVSDIDVVGQVQIAHRAERERLIRKYGKANDEEGIEIINGLFPGLNATMLESFAQLGLQPSDYKRKDVKPIIVSENAEVDDIETLMRDQAAADDAVVEASAKAARPTKAATRAKREEPKKVDVKGMLDSLSDADPDGIIEGFENVSK